VILVAGVPFPELGRIAIDPSAESVDSLPLGPGELAGQNVLLVTLDTTRADRIGCYGNQRAHTPTLDQLAQHGVIFERAFAVAPTTLPSHASIMTGRYPNRHGALVNGVYQLAEEQVTLAELLSSAGYRTGAAVSAFVLDRQFGLAQGFEQYIDNVAGGESAAYRYNEITADATTDRAIDWMRSTADDPRPFFFWIHYFDPHSAYQPPPAYLEQAVGPYDGEITFADAQLARLLDEVSADGQRERTLVVVLADHGEALTQHEESSHGYLVYNSTMRIPMIVSHAAIHGPKQIPSVVSQVDIAPTILSLLGIAAPVSLDGLDLTRPMVERPVFGETRHGYQAYGWAPLFTIIQGNEKLIRGVSPELFDYQVDPREEQDLAAERPGQVRVLEQRLRATFGDELDSAGSSPSASPDAETLQRLAALGYADLSAAPPATARLGDPREMVRVYREVEEAVFTEHGLTEVPARIAHLERIRARHPDFIPALRYLADAYLKSGRAADAEAVYAYAVGRQPAAMELRIGLATATHDTGKLRDAIEIARAIVEEFPVHTGARFLLAAYLLEVGDFDESADQFRAVFNREPSFRDLDVAIVEAFSHAQRLDELATYLSRRLESEPHSQPTRDALGECLLKLGRVEEAASLLGSAPP
jgi:arylsulfatase A-like enzyme/DNA-binding SARP family transcriptional activator